MAKRFVFKLTFSAKMKHILSVTIVLELLVWNGFQNKVTALASCHNIVVKEFRGFIWLCLVHLFFTKEKPQTIKLRPGPNVELQMKRTKLSELSSWSSTFDSFWFVWLISLRSTNTLTVLMCEDRLWDKRRSFHEMNSINRLLICMLMYF